MTQDTDPEIIELYKKIFHVLSEKWNPKGYPKGDDRNKEYLLYVSKLCHMALSGESEAALTESLQSTTIKTFGKNMAREQLIPVAKSIVGICAKK